MKKRGLIAVCTGLLILSMAACGQESTPQPTTQPTQAIVTPEGENNKAEPTMEPTTKPTVEPTAEPTMEPTSEPTTEPTTEPTIVPTKGLEAPFAMVSPVPQEEVTDIAGTMTIESYPRVDGSTATLPLSEAVFMVATGESAEVATQQVVHTKTTNSYHRLYDKEVDLLIVYEPAETIVERMKEEPLCIKPIGLDALVFLANQANPVESLTTQQLIDIYSGKISDWAEVGGLSKEMLAFQRPVGSGSQTLMQKLVMGDTQMVSGDNVFRYSTMSDILEGMLSYNNEDNTLGYSVFYYANNMYFEKDLKLIGVDGVLPSTQTIYDGSYSLTNAFYAVIRTDEPTDSNAHKIFDWLTGEEGQQLVLDLGYVPVQMPKDADISDVKAKPREQVTILTEKTLEEGQYFVFFNPQNMIMDYYYGDLKVYNHNWEEVANFYNVTLNYDIRGVYNQRYLPVGQIRQNTEGEQVVRYGIFDLEQKEYSIVPSFLELVVLDAERGYYAVSPEDGDWKNYRVINGTGEVLLPQVVMEDWLTITKFGNGYWEYSYDYENWENGTTHYFYDENLKLTHVYCQTDLALPPQEEWEEGVEYYVMDGEGCLVDENADVILNWATFLDRYGDGEDFDCRMKFYNPTLAEGKNCFPVWYQNKVYLLDRNLDLIRMVENQKIADSFEGAEFYENFCQYLDWERGDWVYRTYDDEEVLTSDGMKPDGIEINWSNAGYIMHRKWGDLVYVEEYTADGDLLRYTIPLKDENQDYMVYYTEEGYIVFEEDSGEKMRNPYMVKGEKVPRYIVSLYYQGSLIDVKHGLDSVGMYGLDEQHRIWSVKNGEIILAENESVEENFDYSYALADYAILDGTRIVYELDNALQLAVGKDAIFFLSGNYIYAVGYDGTEYLKALHTTMNAD